MIGRRELGFIQQQRQSYFSSWSLQDFTDEFELNPWAAALIESNYEVASILPPTLTSFILAHPTGCSQVLHTCYAFRSQDFCPRGFYLFSCWYGGSRSVGHRAEGGAWSCPRRTLRVPISSNIVNLSSKDGHVLHQGLAKPEAQHAAQQLGPMIQQASYS